MINEDPNMGRKQIFSELPLPSKVEEKGILTLIYKGVFIGVKLLLDIRLNLVKISEGKTIKTKYKQESVKSDKYKKLENPIKGLDDIKIDTKVDEFKFPVVKNEEVKTTVDNSIVKKSEEPQKGGKTDEETKS